MQKVTEEQMWEIIDGEASPEILARHEALLKEDDAYRHEFETCAALQNQLLQLDLEMPSMRFGENVLDQVLPKLEIKRDRNPLYFVLSMGFLTLSSLILFLFVSDNSNQSILPQNTEGPFIAFVSNPMIYNILLITNAFLFFIILDKKIFKPYFQKKLKSVNQ
jgi:hypothetical protein